MKIKSKNFPHPVLWEESDDFTGRMLKGNVDVKAEGIGSALTYKLRVTFSTDSSTLSELIYQRKALYACHVECRNTRFRAVYVACDTVLDAEIPGNRLDGKVEVCCLVVAAEDIENYCSDEFSSVFERAVFRVKKGDILGVGALAEFQVSRAKDALRRTSSIFTVALNKSTDKGPVQIDATGEKIVILLPKAQFQKYKALKTNREMHPILNCCLIVPALTYVLDEMRSGRVEEDRRWCVVLRRRLKDLGANPDDLDSFRCSTFELAQMLIDSPFEDAVTGLERLLTDE